MARSLYLYIMYTSCSDSYRPGARLRLHWGAMDERVGGIASQRRPSEASANVLRYDIYSVCRGGVYSYKEGL